MQIFVVRHAQTHSNLEKRLQGSGSPGATLTREGMEQAARLAQHLARMDLHFNYIYTSDAVRAKRTAAILAESLHAPVTERRELREINCGDWENRTHAELERVHPDAWRKWLSDPTDFCFPRGESLLEVQRRASSLFNQVVLEKRRNVILVSHSATISALLAYVHGWSLLEAWREGRAMHKNTAFTRLYIDDASGKLLDSSLASVEHLKSIT